MFFGYSLKLLLISSMLLVVKGKILRAGKEFSADFNLIDSNARIKMDIIRTFATTKSERECSYNCIKEEDCVSFNRHKENGRCELLDVSKFDNVSLLQRDNGWSHYETDDDQQNIGSVCMQLSPCKEYQVCEDTFFKSKPYKCRCRDGFKGPKCKTYNGPGSNEKNPSTSSCRLLQMKFRSFPDDDYWFKGRKHSTRCERRVDGRYEMWSSYGPCSSTECGVNGNQERNRTCNNPPPKGGGKDCRGLGKSREVKPCKPQCTNIFFENTPYKITSFKLLGTIPKWHKEYQVQFYFKLDLSKIINGNWYSLIHVTTGENNQQYGSRIPLVTLHAGISAVRIFVCSGVNGDKNKFWSKAFDFDYFKNWVKVDVSQLLDGEKFMFSANVDDEDLFEAVENKEPEMFYDVKLYVNNPWVLASHALIRSLYVRGGEITPTP